MTTPVLSVLRTPKGTLIVLLAALVAIAATHEGFAVVAPGLLSAVTAAAAVELVRHLGGELVGLAFLIELGFLNGRAKLPGQQVLSVLQY